MQKLKKILFVSDCHHPYADTRAWRVMLKVGKSLKPDVVVVLGDFIDAYPLSTFSKDPNRGAMIDTEIEFANERLDELDSLGPSRNIFIAGNHSKRLERYLADKAPALYNQVKIEKLLKLKSRGWEYVPYRSDIKIGKLYITHDVGYASRTAVFRNLDSYQHSIVTGHTHRLSYIVEGDATGRPMVSATLGWLGDVEKADYMHQLKARRDWALGFGIGYLEVKTGLVFVVPMPIVQYKCLLNGEIIS